MQWQTSRGMSARPIFCALLLGIGQSVCAQTFPSAGWLPLTQQTNPLGDPLDGTFSAPLEIVGDKGAPGAFVASDASYLYFRLRVAASPYHTAVHHLYTYLWACLLDIDQAPQTYELLVGLDGAVVPNTVDLDQNTSTAVADDLGDPAETPRASYDAAIYAQYAPSASTLGGGTDYFVDWAVAWTDLNAGGLAKAAAFRAVCGTSTNALNLSSGDVLDGGSGSKSFSADSSDAVVCDDAGCRYDTVFADGFEGR